MSVLHNLISNKQLRYSIITESELRTTVSFYHYFNICNPKSFRDHIYKIFTKLRIFGRIYIAFEGINAQISVPRKHFNTLRNIVYNLHPKLNGIHLNIALDNDKISFWVLRVKVRPYIVYDGINDHTFNFEKGGTYLKVEEVNTMIDDTNALFVDIRNSYEYEIGHFKNAIKIPYNTFRLQLQMIIHFLKNYKNKKIILYCTGGIRCEKASAWMLHNGFKNVYQLEGGIIKYVNYAHEKNLPLKFIGKIFVFDERLSERVTKDIIAHCYQCGSYYDNYTNCRNQNCYYLFIQCPICSDKYQGFCSIQCKELLNK